MSKVNDIRLIGIKGMNIDLLDKYVSPEHVQSVRNAIRTWNGGYSNLEGTKEIPFGESLSSIAKVVGACPDYKNNAIIYFINDYISFICRYYISTEEIEVILKTSYFYPQGNINSMNVIGGLLYWTDGVNSPRKININKAIAYTANPLSFPVQNPLTQYLTIDEQILDVIKYPPPNAPTLAYMSKLDVLVNNIRGKLWQFRYCYIYDDKEKSVWSPISRIALPSGDELANGVYIKDESFNNYIQIIFDKGTTEVHKVQIAVREGNYGHWKLIETVNKYDEEGNYILPSDPVYYNFYNNEVGLVLDQADTERLFDYVPQLAGDQEIIEKNRLLYADITEGYDNVEIGVNLEAVFQNDFTYENTSIILLSITDQYYSSELDRWFWKVTLPTIDGTHYGFAYEDSVYQINLIDISADHNVSYNLYYKVQAGDSISVVLENLEAQIDDLVGYYAFNETYPVNVLWISVYEDGNIPEPDTNQTCTGAVYRCSSIYTSFKSGSWYEFGITYFDRANRSGALNVSIDTKIYIPLDQELNSVPIYTKTNRIQWEINHIPPSWATHYKWYCSGNNTIEDFIQFNIADICRVNGLVEVEMNSNILLTTELHKKSKLESWEWRKGDRIRFLRKGINLTTFIPLNFTEVLDFEIQNYTYPTLTDNSYEKDSAAAPAFILDENGNKIRKKSEMVFCVDDFTFEKVSTNTGDVNLKQIIDGGGYVVVEIYRPKKEIDSENRIFYEFGEEYAIVGGLHQGETQHQLSNGTPAEGRFKYGDIYIRLRSVVDTVFPVESFSFSDFYKSNYWSRGRVGIVDANMVQQRFETKGRFSGLKIQDTQTNDLSTFGYKDSITLKSKFGRITSIEEVGYTLRVRQLYKRSSIYIGRAGLRQASEEGRDIVAVTDNVLGTVYESEARWGCQNPESVASNGTYSYYVDLQNGAILREASNGTIAISDEGVKDWTKETCKTLLNECENVEIFTGIDNKNGKIYFTFKGDYTSSSNKFLETIVYSEKDKEWDCYLDLYDASNNAPENYAFIGQTLISFIQGQLWLHNDNVLRNRFYGVDRDWEINVVINKEWNLDKSFKVIIIDSAGTWACEEIIIPENGSRSEMFSRIKSGRFKGVKGKQIAKFAKNMKSSTGTADDLLNGNDLVGLIMKIKLVNTQQTEVILSNVEVKSLKV